ncbi:MAG TPA: hypothetical protein VHF86_09635 [Xanthomonadaceae bacterium]|nr:hypothetical protein [Xanthomonadaceae bacterium]
MIRKLLLPAACAALLGACASYGYGDGYYYGRPSVQYHGGASYGYPYYYDGYGYPSRYGYGYGGYGYGGYGYGYPYYGYPYRYYYRRPGHHHDHDDDHDHGDDDDNDGKPPWRRRWADDSGDMLRRRVDPDARPSGSLPTPSRPRAVIERPAPTVAPRPGPRVDRPAPRPVRSAPMPRNRPERDVRRERER